MKAGQTEILMQSWLQRDMKAWKKKKTLVNSVGMIEDMSNYVAVHVSTFMYCTALFFFSFFVHLTSLCRI